MAKIRHLWVGIINIKRAEFKHEKVRNIILQEFRKHSKIFMKQERRERVNNSDKTTFFLTHSSTIVYDVWIFWRNQLQFSKLQFTITIYNLQFPCCFCLVVQLFSNFCKNQNQLFWIKLVNWRITASYSAVLLMK